MTEPNAIAGSASSGTSFSIVSRFGFDGGGNGPE